MAKNESKIPTFQGYEIPDEFKNHDLVFHGSPKCFTIANPSPTSRTDKKGDLVYKGTSLHVARDFYIALSYTTKSPPTGVSLYSRDNIIHIFCTEEEFKKTKSPGYIYAFESKNFYSKSGLGPLELIAETPQIPLFCLVIDDIPNAFTKQDRLAIRYHDSKTVAK